MTQKFEQKLIEFITNVVEKMGYDVKVEVTYREDKKLGIKMDSSYSSILYVGIPSKCISGNLLAIRFYFFGNFIFFCIKNHI